MKTKRLKSDLARIRAVIEGDRRNVSCDVENMLKYDLMCVLGGYFDFCSPPHIVICSKKGGVEVMITARAKNVRPSGRSAQEA